jgi:hypothetical protein
MSRRIRLPEGTSTFRIGRALTQIGWSVTKRRGISFPVSSWQPACGGVSDDAGISRCVEQSLNKIGKDKN